jgi:hypothetical protein
MGPDHVNVIIVIAERLKVLEDRPIRLEMQNARGIPQTKSASSDGWTNTLMHSQPRQEAPSQMVRVAQGDDRGARKEMAYTGGQDGGWTHETTHSTPRRQAQGSPS